MKAFVVSLGDPQHLICALSEKGIASEIVGVDGRSLSAGHYFSLASQRGGNLMTPGEVGCALSHKEIYEKIINCDDDCKYLVLEDDVAFSEFFFEKLNEIKNESYDIILLGGQDNNPDRFYLWGYIDCLGIAEISPFFAKRVWSTCGYVLNRKAADMIRLHQERKFNRADNWGEWASVLGLKIGFVNIIKHPPDRSKSIIEGERRLVDRYRSLRGTALVSAVRALRFVYFSTYGFLTGRKKLFRL